MARLASRLLSGFLLALSLQFPSHSAERSQLVVYSTLEADFLAELKKAFEANNPDLSILWQGIAKPIPFYPEGVAASMIKNDLVWAAENRDRIIAEWQRRYGKR